MYIQGGEKEEEMLLREKNSGREKKDCERRKRERETVCVCER